MAYENLPEGYHPEHVTTRSLTIENMLRALSRPEDRENAQRYIAMQEQSEADSLNTLLKIVVEQGGDEARETKARYMLQIARHVSDRERTALAPNHQAATSRQVQVGMGLQSLTEHPGIFLAALESPDRPRPEELNLLGLLINLSPLARASYMRTLPAPAALAAIGAVNAATAILDLHRDQPKEKAAVPFLMNVANAWLQISAQLAAPDLPPAPAEPPAAPELRSPGRRPGWTSSRKPTSEPGFQPGAREQTPTPGRLPQHQARRPPPPGIIRPEQPPGQQHSPARGRSPAPS